MQHYRRSLGRFLLATTALTLALGATMAGPSVARAQNLPTGYSTAAGSVGFARTSATLTINQSSQNAIVNYQSFSIGQKNTVNIVQPNASSALLTRVKGSTPSTIAGHLNANGQVYLINPNGIAITKTGVVKVGGGFVASSLGMSDDEWKHGRKKLKGDGASAAVTNAGTISIGRGGYAALIGGTVTNSGLISVPMGKVGLGSGEAATLDVSGDGFLQVAVPTGTSTGAALIQQSGTIRAVGGSVVIDAATARAAARNAVNISGGIDAHSISGHDGSIVIGGGEGGAVELTGALSVASRHATGGSITLSGQQIALRGAKINASGANGGGTIRIGGDLHGTGPLQNADGVTIDGGTTIKADATGSGNGGSVVVWSDTLTNFAGSISAKGGPNSGDGGRVEVSSHGVLGYTGLMTTLAPKGEAGTLLLDPYDVVISGATDSDLRRNDQCGHDDRRADRNLGDRRKHAGGAARRRQRHRHDRGRRSPGTDAGNITVAAPLAWSSGNLLTLTAANAIAINATITVEGAGQSALNTGTTTIGGSTQPLLSFGAGASVTYASSTGAAISSGAGGTLAINGAPYTLLYSMNDVGGINNSPGNYALATNLNASGISYGGAVVPSFSGTFEGLGNTISNLTV